MSSTNRGYDRHKSDYYVTPISDIELFLNEFIKHEPEAFTESGGGVILDPTSGGSELHPMSYPKAIHNVYGIDLTEIKTIDIREDSLAEVKGDYLKTELDYKPNVIITNPPFKIAEDIIRKSLKDVANDGWVVMLLRLNYLEGKARFNGLWNDIGLPKYVFVHHKRMSFTEDGRADSVAYMHAVWKKGYKPNFTKLRMI